MVSNYKILERTNASIHGSSRRLYALTIRVVPSMIRSTVEGLLPSCRRRYSLDTEAPILIQSDLVPDFPVIWQKPCKHRLFWHYRGTHIRVIHRQDRQGLRADPSKNDAI